MSATLAIALCAVHSAAFGAFHLLFWRLFDWKRELPKLRPANRAIVQILNLRLTYVFFAVAALCAFYPAELAGTPLGRALLAAMALFWLGRAVEQVVFLRRVHHPAVHALTLLFLLGAALFAWPLWRGP